MLFEVWIVFFMRCEQEKEKEKENLSYGNARLLRNLIDLVLF